MYILNLESNPKIIENSVCVNKMLSDWLIENGIPLLGQSQNGSFFYFAITQNLMDTLKRVPLWLRLFVPRIDESKGGDNEQ